jgi:hypothetical protein
MLGNLTRDWAFGNIRERQLVHDLLTRIEQADAFIFITFDHIQELIRHENDQVVDSRLRFLAQIPLLAWCSHYHGEMDLGGILDLGAYEIEAIENGGGSPSAIRESVRAKLIRLGSGWELVNRNAEQWLAVRPLLIDRLAREREIASLTHRPLFEAPGRKGMTVGELLALPVPPEHEFEMRGRYLKEQVVKKLAIQADPKLNDLMSTADRFVSLVASDKRAALGRAMHPFEFMIAQSGLDPESVSPEMDLAYVIEMMMLAKKSNAIREYMRRPHHRFRLTDDRLGPSLELWRRLQKRMGALPRADGSNLADRYIASFALYLDFLQADRRTNEFVRQIQREQWDYGATLGAVFAAGTVAKMDATLAKLFT